MKEEHPATPPPELVQQWLEEADTFRFLVRRRHQYIADRAAQWGADQAKADIKRKLQGASDQELEACCEWLINKLTFREDGIRFADELRAARRPKPPSLKEQALEELDAAILRGDWFSTSTAKDIIRRALESIPDPS